MSGGLGSAILAYSKQKIMKLEHLPIFSSCELCATDLEQVQAALEQQSACLVNKKYLKPTCYVLRMDKCHGLKF